LCRPVRNGFDCGFDLAAVGVEKSPHEVSRKFFFRCPPCLLRASVAYHFSSHNYRKEESMWRVCSCLEYKIYWMDSRCLACPAPCWRFTNGGNTRNRFPWMRSTSASRIFKSSLSSGTSSNKSAKENVIQSSTSAVAFSPTPPCVVRA